MDMALSATKWVVGKALAPVADGLLQTWADSKDLSLNIEALNTELLYTQTTLETASSKQLAGPAMEELLQKMRDLAHNAEDVLDELDYFRIHDELYGTYEAADKHAKGCGHDLVLNARHTAKAVGKLILCAPAATSGEPREEDATRQRVRQRARGNSSSTPNTNQAGEEVSGCMGKLGKIFPCSSFPHVHDDDDNDDSGQSILCGACMRKAPQSKHDVNTTNLRFNRVDISNRMKHIVEKLKPIRTEVNTILNGCSRRIVVDTAHSRRKTISESEQPKLYGRDPIVKRIIHDITEGKHSGKDLTVLPIVGPGGIGKTTLIQHIHQSQEVRTHFQVVIWVCVSLNFNPNKLLKEIKNHIPKVKGEKDGGVREVIEQRLKSKRFLLILDDMWKCDDENDWLRLLMPLKKSQKKGSMILVTTRLQEIAKMVKTTDHYIELGGIEPEEFRKLFIAFVFGDEQCRSDHIFLLETGEKILKKLKGSPLAAKTVGRLLRGHLDLHYWRMVLESKEWEMQTGDHDIMPALKLSYDYLPFYLQQCFFYCALFPEDYKFSSKELIHFWIGLDIIHSGGPNRTAEDIGLRNLNDLVTHGFFRKDETDGIQYYIIHDLLHNLALKVASHDCLSLYCSNVRSVQIGPCIRHLSIIIDNEEDNNAMASENLESELKKLKTRLGVEKLQTLMLFGEMDESLSEIFVELFREANALRILHISRMAVPLESMLHNFVALFHLRYLRLGSVSQSSMNLPNAISRFYHLKILDLEEWHGHRDLPRDMCNLSKLCHFPTMHDDLHSSIYNVGKLKLLQELNAFKVNSESEGFEQKQLEPLTDLRELAIYNLEKINTKEEAAEAKLIDKNYLQKLTLDWDGKRPNIEPDVEEQVLESLQPHRNLQDLNIRGNKGPSCPTWLGEKLVVEALRSLHLFDVSWKVFPPFGKMWGLVELTLENIATIKEFGLEQSFCKLLRLTLVGLESFEKWVPQDTHLFPLLQVMIIKDCPKLLELPCSNYILDPLKQDWNTDWFPRLQKLEIGNCPKVMSLPPIPWTETLCFVNVTGVGSKLPVNLVYSKTSSIVELEITGKADMRSLDQLLVFNKLTELQNLKITDCPPLELKHLIMLTSLKKLSIDISNALVVPSAGHGDVEWQHPLEHLQIQSCSVSGKELTQLLSHLPKLSGLEVAYCQNIRRLVVGVDTQETTSTALSSISLDSIVEDTKANLKDVVLPISLFKRLCSFVYMFLHFFSTAKDELVGEDEVVFPAHLLDSLQNLDITCFEASVVVPPLNALQALHTLWIWDCELASFSSTCCPFPSSLRELHLVGSKCLRTLELLSNLTSLTSLNLRELGEDLRCEGLLHLLSKGQLSELRVFESPNFFAGWDPEQGLQHEEGQLLLSTSSNPRDLWTDDFEGVLAAPICRFLSSSLTKLIFTSNKEVECFTKEQEESLHLLTSLQELTFWCCNKLQCLPAGLHKLTNLKILHIMKCPALRSLPKDGLPSSLQVLDVSDCENKELKQQCRQLVGTIPRIWID